MSSGHAEGVPDPQKSQVPRILSTPLRILGVQRVHWTLGGEFVSSTLSAGRPAGAPEPSKIHKSPLSFRCKRLHNPNYLGFHPSILSHSCPQKSQVHSNPEYPIPALTIWVFHPLSLLPSKITSPLKPRVPYPCPNYLGVPSYLTLALKNHKSAQMRSTLSLVSLPGRPSTHPPRPVIGSHLIQNFTSPNFGPVQPCP
jgi:hypothetical protein